MAYLDKIKERLLKKGIWLVTGTVDLEMIHLIFDWIVSNPDKQEFTLAINSSGGAPIAAQSFSSLIRTLDSKVKIHGVAINECGSAAMALFQCCHTRTAVEGCGFFIHNMQHKPSIDCEAFDTKKLKADILATQELHQELIAYQANRCNMTEKQWRKLATEGSLTSRPIFCKRAKKLGLIDNIISSYPIFGATDQ